MSFDATLVVMAAGMGSRFGGLKQLEPMGPNGESILDFSVYDAKAAGFTKVVFVIKKSIEAEFKAKVGSRIEKKINVGYVFQETDKLPGGYTCPEGREKPWGTGQAVLCCRDEVTTPFAVINADDFYGASAFKQIYEQLKADSKDYCMVGFRLGNTTTENGYVSRGVCVTENGLLTDINENPKIDSDCVSEIGGEKIQLSPDTVVSMNMWGFGTDFFGFLEADFKEFLDESGKELKSEFYLPSVVDKLIKNGTKQVKVLVAEDKWYGVTYKEDKDAVVSAIAGLIADGKYDGI